MLTFLDLVYLHKEISLIDVLNRFNFFLFHNSNYLTSLSKIYLIFLLFNCQMDFIFLIMYLFFHLDYIYFFFLLTIKNHIQFLVFLNFIHLVAFKLSNLMHLLLNDAQFLL
jgi:hypothetical protein